MYISTTKMTTVYTTVLDNACDMELTYTQPIPELQLILCYMYYCMGNVFHLTL